MLLSKFLFTILITIVSKTIFKPCGSVHNVKQLNEVKYSFLQSDNKDNNTPVTVNTGETVDVASNKVDTSSNNNQSGTVVSKTTDSEVHNHQDSTVGTQQPVVTTDVKKDEHHAQEQNQKVEETKDEGHSSVDNKAKDEEHNQEKSTNEEKGKNETKEVEQHKEKNEDKDKQEEHENEEHKEVNENKNEGGNDHSVDSVESGHSTQEHTVQAVVTPHQPSGSHNEVESKKEEDVNQHKQEEHNKEEGENDKSTVEKHEEDSSNKQEEEEEHEDHKSNKDDDHEKQEENEEEHEEGGEQEEEHEEGEQHKTEGPVTVGESQDLHGKGEENEEKAEHGDQETASDVKNDQQPVVPPVSVSQPSLQNNQTNLSEVKPHDQTTPTTEQPHATSVSAQVSSNVSNGSANSTPDAYKVDLNNLTDDQKRAVKNFYEKPGEFCSVDCSHSCKSELGGSTQCVSQTESSVSCSTFDDPKNLTCPSGYTPCAQPNVTTLKSFTLKKGSQEVGALEVDGSNFNNCMGFVLAPSNGVCDKEHLVHNLLFTSDKVNLDYQSQVASDKLTFSNLTIKDGEYKVCLFMRYQPSGNVGLLSDWYKKIVEFFNPTHDQSQPLRTVFVLEVGSLKVSD